MDRGICARHGYHQSHDYVVWTTLAYAVSAKKMNELLASNDDLLAILHGAMVRDLDQPRDADETHAILLVGDSRIEARTSTGGDDFIEKTGSGASWKNHKRLIRESGKTYRAFFG
jgi:hypothetical protein